MTSKQSRRTQRALERALFGPEPTVKVKRRPKMTPATPQRDIMQVHRDEADQQLAKVCDLAIGRIWRLFARPYQHGDERQYWMARGAFLDAFEALHPLR